MKDISYDLKKNILAIITLTSLGGFSSTASIFLLQTPKEAYLGLILFHLFLMVICGSLWIYRGISFTKTIKR